MKTKLTGRIVRPGDPAYKRARTNFNQRFNKFPRVIVFAQKTSDVVNAIKWAREHNVPIRARSGRHALASWSLINDGIVIDVSEMKKVKVNSRSRLASVEPGNRQLELVRKLSRYNLALPVGDYATIGIAGLTLGGGLGLLTRKFGLTSDNLIGIEMVDAKGRILEANAKKNSDLFWASRGGGGGNFGIVTNFKFKTRPLKRVTIYEITWDFDILEELLKTWQKFAPFTDNRLGSILTLSSKNGSHVSSGQFMGSKKELLRLLKPLLSIRSAKLKILCTLPFARAFKTLAKLQETNPPRKFRTSSAFVNRILPNKAIKIIRRFLENPPITGSTVDFLNLGGAVSKIPINSTAFFHRKALIYTEWTFGNAKNQRQLQSGDAWVEGLRKALKPFTRGAYINVPNVNQKNFGTAYYGTNFARLRRVKAKYDPENVFNFPQSIPPARRASAK